jgi:hypothetical protein
MNKAEYDADESIFSAIEYLKKSISEKTPVKNSNYFTIQRLNPHNRELIEAYLLLEKPEWNKSNLLSKAFKKLFPLQYEFDSNKILVRIKQTKNKDYETRNYLDIIDINYSNLEKVCQEVCETYDIVKSKRIIN